MFKDSLPRIPKFVESDEKIQVMWNVCDVVCLECGMLGLWIIGMWDVDDARCWGFGICGM